MCLKNEQMSKLFRSAVNQVECCDISDNNNNNNNKNKTNRAKKDSCNVTISNSETKNDEIDQNINENEIPIDTLNIVIS